MNKFFTLTFFILIFSTSYALSPEPRIPDEALEERARNLFLEVRCLVCEGQVIESSNTEFSYEMRKLIRRKILEGKSDEVIKSELVKEFGEDILTQASGANKFLLLFLPITFAAAIGFTIFKTLKNEHRKSA